MMKRRFLSVIFLLCLLTLCACTPESQSESYTKPVDQPTDIQVLVIRNRSTMMLEEVPDGFDEFSFESIIMQTAAAKTMKQDSAKLDTSGLLAFEY